MKIRFIILICLLCIRCTKDNFYTDPRDGNIYSTIQIGNAIWFSENLRFKHESSTPYEYNLQNVKKHGRLYSISAKDNVCPDGWHTASYEDWEAVALKYSSDYERNEYGNLKYNIGNRLFDGGESGLNIKLSGYYSDNNFSFIEKGVVFWTDGIKNDSIYTWYLHDNDLYDSYVYLNKSSVKESEQNMFCIRCVKN